MQGVDDVVAAVGLRDDFLKRHRKDRRRAQTAWDAFRLKVALLRSDPFLGTQIPKDRFPAAYARYDNLWKLDLPHAFRAIYTVIGRPGRHVVVAVDWIGDHDEYDALFGYD